MEYKNLPLPLAWPSDTAEPLKSLPQEPAPEKEETKQIGPRLRLSLWRRLHQCAHSMEEDMQDVIEYALTEYFDRNTEHADKPMSEKAWKRALSRRRKR